MAYVTPTTVSTGCLISAASWNQNVVNNVIQMATSPLFFDFTNDRIGIGTATPGVPLDVYAPATTLLAAQFRGRATANERSAIYLLGACSGSQLFGLIVDRGATGVQSFAVLDVVNSQARFFISPSGAALINASVVNTFNTQGLTILDSTSAAGEILSLKSTRVTHGMTAVAETDTYGSLVMEYAGATVGGGGLAINGYSGSVAGTNMALVLSGQNGLAADTTKSTAGRGIVTSFSYVKSGTGLTVAASTGNIMVIANSTSARFIFQGGGDLFADSGLTASAYDSHDDVQMVRALEVERAPGTVIRDQFDSWLKYNRRDLEVANIAAFNDPAEGGDGSVFVNVMGLQRLHSGAIWQMHKHTRQLEERIAQLEQLLLGPPRAGAT